ncbi:MAG TPA: carboxypeptidase regulatory-like domain-containing protein [Pyrinomonadaceae bacterium]|nr:carboxypeptidase regulatory-like domain-containing protein [Pyrinomonadaceae bacterium]
MSKRSTHAHAFALLAALCLAHATAPSVTAQKEAPASVSGRVRDGERGAAGVNVVLLSSDSPRIQQVARARTDADGHYLLSNVAPGRYQIMPVAPVYVLNDAPVEMWPPGRPLTLLAGENVSDVDFSVERGGVITGRVTDEGGNPVIAEPVNVEPADDKTPRATRGFLDQRGRQTDDRGIYRVYGLAPGRYRVSVGTAGENGAVGYGRRKVFERTYYPGVTEKEQARLVELKAGEESTDVDIAIGRAIKTYRASGRFVFADTGQPAPGISFGYSITDGTGRMVGGFGGGMTTNERGEFYTEQLAPGRYYVFAAPNWNAPSELYSDAVGFEVTNADVTGLVVPLKRGASVSGSVTVEGVTDRALLTKLLSQVRVYGWVDTGDRSMPMNGTRPSPLNPDGTFVITGLRPGKLRLFFNEGEATKSLSLMRVELNGAPVGNDGIPVTEGAQVTGARIRLNYGTAVIRGQVNFVNGTPPPNARILVMAHAILPGASAGEMSSSPWRRAEADVRGIFRLEGLPAGEYDLIVNVVNAGNRPVGPVRQRVTVADGAEVSVTPTIDFDKPLAPPRPPPPGVVVTPPNP